MPIVHLSDRAVIIVSGPDAEALLQNLVTTDLSPLKAGVARPGALLSPQGKILFDFLVSRAGGEALRLDCRAETAPDFQKRLMLYKLRAKAEISAQEQAVVAVSWGNDSPAGGDPGGVADLRFPEDLGVTRHYGAAPGDGGAEEEWHRLRIAHGVGESGSDYAPGDAFPHDVLFDQNGGVGLRKGCYVGQEVVSRMHHRGTARRRLVIVRGQGPLPASGTELTADGRPLGTLGTVSGADGLAIVRIDRVADARQAGTPVLAGEAPVELTVPAHASFTLDGAGGDEAETA